MISTIKYSASAAAIMGFAAFHGAAMAQQATEAGDVTPDTPVTDLPAGVVVEAAPPLPITGLWDADVVTGVLDADCFNQAADSGSGRVSERTDVYGRTGGRRWIAFEQDCGIRNRGRVNKPMYKPEYWEWIQLADYNANVGGEWIEYADPEWQNLIEGVPRMGPPDKITYNVDPIRGPEATFFWAAQNTFKIIPAGCGELPDSLAYDQTLLGYATGCFEEGSFVVHSKGFADTTWLHWAGWPHSNEMEVIERFTPNEDGSQMLYEVTVIDPVYLLEPWEMDPDILQRNENPEAMIMQDVPYQEQSLGALALPRNRG